VTEFYINSSIVTLRPMTRDDVPLVYRLRHSMRGQWLNPTSLDIQEQYRYFENYQIRYSEGHEIYFVIQERQTSRDVGVTRVTNLRTSGRFGWEGLIIDSSAVPGAAIDTTLTVYSFGFLGLSKEVCGPWKVLKRHSRVNALHSRMGIADCVGEESDFYVYEVYSNRFISSIAKYNRQGFANIDWPLDFGSFTSACSPKCRIESH